jgi:hypothetical protein
MAPALALRLRFLQSGAMLLDALAGVWSGTNVFRLMPVDPFVGSTATATLQVTAGGALAAFTYAWLHPEDGTQDGLLVVWPGADEGHLAGVWADSWHQRSQPMDLLGPCEPDGTLAHLGCHPTPAAGFSDLSSWSCRCRRHGAL